MTTSIAIAYGSGGHAEQAQRFVRKIGCDKMNMLIIKEFGARAVCPKGRTLLEVPAARPKHGYSILKDWIAMVLGWFRLVWIVMKLQPAGLITFGPGMCVPLAVIFRLCGKKVVHVETWCRFNTRSITGRIMYHLSNRFYVQNRPLLRVYPKAIYAGRL